ncbi:MAG: RtcB family protein [Methanoregulaceae archaeon]
MVELSGARTPVKLWVAIEDVEQEALQQMFNAANHPLTFHHVAGMPDIHKGYSLPIGGVWAVGPNDAGVLSVCPAAVGYDIGCGMCACRTGITVDELPADTVRTIAIEIKQKLPAGVGSRAASAGSLPDLPDGCSRLDLPIVDRDWQSAEVQLGTLGAGNHFAELQSDGDGRLWVMLHSGSRNVGWNVADHYMKVAHTHNGQFGNQAKDVAAWDLPTMPVDSDDGRAYLWQMEWCLAFALENRRVMMDLIKAIVKKHVWTTFGEMININHNAAWAEEHFGETVMVHRKGATQAFADQVGIIPGSQGTRSYIVRGLGNPGSFCSCSHGAGRLLSRSKAKKTLDLEEEKRKMDEQGIIHFMSEQADLDEAASAYKPIDVVMANQADLVEIGVELTPLAVIKG